MSDTLVIRDGLGGNLNAKQLAFTRAANNPDVDHVGIGGSFGAGKTQAGARQIVAWAWAHPADYLVIRETYRRLEDSTKKVLLKGDGGLPAAIPSEMYHPGDYRVVDNEVRLKTGGVIKFRSVEDPKEAIDAVKNMTLGGYLIDQVEELADDRYEELFDTLQGRLRAPNTPMKGLSISNPDQESHWYFRRVVDEKTRDQGAVYIHVVLMDNVQNLPEKYVKQMLSTEKTRPDYYARYVLGKWGVFGGQRYKIFNPLHHVVPAFPVPPEWTVIEGYDYGWADSGWSKPFVGLWVAIDPWDRYYVVAEQAMAETRVSVFADGVKDIRKAYNLQPSSIWLDPAAWAARAQYASPAAEMMEAGILVAPAANDRLGGWNHIEELLARFVEDPDDSSKTQPALVIMEGRAPQLERELPSLRIKEGTNDVEKKNDHASDTLRYIVNARPPKPPAPEKDRYDELIERKLERLKARAEERLYET